MIKYSPKSQPNWNELIKDYSAAGQQHALDRRPNLWVFGYIPEGEILSNYVSSNAKLLDFGCGNGRMARYLRYRIGCEVVGVDINPEAIARAQAFNDGNHYLVIKENEIPDSIAPFDGCLSNHVFPTYSSRDEIVKSLQAIRRCLNSGSPLIIYVDNTNYTNIRYTTFIGGIPGKKYTSGEPWPMKIYLGETQVMDFHDYFWTPEDYLEAIRLAGYTDATVTFPTYNVEYQRKYEEYFGFQLSEEFEKEKAFPPAAIYSAKA